jgi:hypothetical protein
VLSISLKFPKRRASRLNAARIELERCAASLHSLLPGCKLRNLSSRRLGLSAIHATGMNHHFSGLHPL